MLPNPRSTPVHDSSGVFIIIKVLSGKTLLHVQEGSAFLGGGGGISSALKSQWIWHCFAATRSLVIKKSGDEERRHLIAVIDFNTQQRVGRDFIGQWDTTSTNRDAKEKST
ncbi:Hypothetical predicted protein [Scomber scombrus]|uniref:Uncharacterized protein n=1 Tax=Scomber scombrus TaxID=13677 RepID=A0AAV1P5V7_SCOSC